MRRLMTTILFLLALPVFAQQQFDKLAADTMSAWRVPGLAVAVVQNDRVIYMKGFGVKEIGKTDPVTPDTLFEIASTTKAFTTTAMAMLVDQKKLNWDDPVRNSVEYFHLDDPCADAMVTLRDIVSHRTGLSRHDELWDYTDWNREQVIRSVASVKLTKPFRSTYQYQNIMFALAGQAVASAAKMSWEDFVQSHIFDPLGMTHTRIAFADWNASAHAVGHRWDSATQRVSVEPYVDYTRIAPAGQIKSCVRDMAHWLRFQLAGGMIDGKRLISAEALDETHTPQTVIRLEGLGKEANPETNLEAYGLGWVIQDYRGQLLVTHAGAINGFRTQVSLLPKQNAGVVVMANLGRGLAPLALRNLIFDQLLGGPTRDWNQLLLDIDRKSDAEGESKKKERESKRHLNTKPSRELSAYAGTYTDPAYGAVSVTNDGNGLTLHWYRLNAPLTHFHYDTFNLSVPEEDLDEQVQFTLGPDGEVRSMTLFGEEFVKK
jgi:CubicO group peptidase (beta-lactamase class C family)